MKTYLVAMTVHVLNAATAISYYNILPSAIYSSILDFYTVVYAPPITPPHYIIALTSLRSTPPKISETIVDELFPVSPSTFALVEVMVGGVRGETDEVAVEKTASSE